MVLRRILTCRGRFHAQNGVTAQNDEQPIRLPNGLLYPRVEVEQRTHSGEESERHKGLADEERKCEMCTLRLVEAEIHFLITYVLPLTT